MLCPGSLAPCFVNNDYVTVEIIQSTANARQEVLDSLDHGLLCAVQIHELHLRSGGITATLCPLGLPQEERLYRVRRHGCCASQERRWRLQFLWLLAFSSSSPTCTVSTTGSTNSVRHVNRISNMDAHGFYLPPLIAFLKQSKVWDNLGNNMYESTRKRFWCEIRKMLSPAMPLGLHTTF